MNRLYILIFLILGVVAQSNAQRYLTEVFDDVEVTQNVIYGVNATVLAIPQLGEAVPQPLILDFYEPAGDTLVERPLVIYFHTGNFLPHPQNGSPSGTKRDSTAVEICRRLAKMGYVVASAEYRLGWNPVAPDRDVRVFTLINAAYRGVQDANTAIRYFKRTFAEAANPHGVDTSRITLFGQGTGGYISMNTNALDDYNKIPTASNGKFLLTVGPTIIPMIIEGINGNVEGTIVGIVPPDLAPVLGVPAGDTLCYPNHVGYSSDFQLAVNVGGAIGDTAWVDPGQRPIISFQVPTDPFAPYVEGLVLVPVDPPLEVVEVQGSYLVQKLSNDYGNNQVFTDANIMDDYTTVANQRNDGYEGLCPLIGQDGPNDSSPWDYWDPVTNPNHESGLQTNPSMSREKAHAYIDTIIGYFAPRAYVALDLMTTSVENEVIKVDLLVYPNPATDEIFIASEDNHPIQRIQLFDMSGRLVQQADNINNQYYMLKRDNLPAGTYFLNLIFEAGAASHQVQFR